MNLIAEIALYGTSQTGAGYISRSSAKTYGDGAIRTGRSFTEAIFLACDELWADGIDGDAWVYAPNGDRRAQVHICSPKAFGDLTWEAVA